MVERAWLLNLDAELELATRGAYTSGRLVNEQIRVRLASFERFTLDEPVYGQQPIGPGRRVFCWCPTPSALTCLSRANLHAVAGPSVEVLRRANHRAALLGFASPGLQRRFLKAEASWSELLLGSRSPTGSWRLKRCFGFAGRGQRRIGAAMSADDRRWVEDSLRHGGLLREVDLTIDEEFSIHGMLSGGQLLLGEPVQFTSDAHGAPESAHRLVGGQSALRAALEDGAEKVAIYLNRLGYFGPLGVDAFTWRGAHGTELNPVSDINARFTMAWSLGLGARRELALERYAATSAR